MENKKIEEYTVIELKAILFDLDQEVKARQSQMSQIGGVLRGKLQEEQVEVKKEVKK